MGTASLPPSRERLRGLTAALVVVAGVAAFGLPMFAAPGGITSGDPFRDNDWLNCRAFDLMTRQAMLDDGQFPLRSHLVGGGFPTIAHPSDGSWAPTLAAVLLLGDVAGVKVNILLLMLLGCWGVYGLCRQFLGLGRGAGLFGALLFGFSGWLPSMLLVGFYHQLFYLAAPGILLLLLTSRARVDRLILAGLLLAVVLQQGGNAFTCVVYFLAMALWLVAAADAAPEAPRWRRHAGPLALLLLLLGSPALAWSRGSVLPLLLGWGGAAAWIAGRPGARRFIRALWPWALRLGLVLVVACTLGGARLAGLYYLQTHGVRNQHQDVCRDIQRHGGHECFYDGLPRFARGLLQRVPAQAEYRQIQGRRVEPLSYEYAWLGLTLPPLLLCLLGVLWRGLRSVMLAALALLFSAICFGWHLPLDVRLLLTSGVPGLSHLGQPIKYFNFFILLPLVLLSAAGLQGIVQRVTHPLGRRLLWAGAAALLLLPFVQNRPALGELFRNPVSSPARQPYQQHMQIGARTWLDLPQQELRRRVARGGHGPLRLRESGRPAAATEYHNVLRGAGTIDWYGTLLLPEHAVPRRYLLPDGSELDNPGYRGEAWIPQGGGSVHQVRIQPNTIHLDVTLPAAGLIVINQNYLEGFVSSAGTVERVPAPGQAAGEPGGLLGVRLQQPGRHSVQITYRPGLLMAGLATSGVSLLAWLAALGWLAWRRCQAARSGRHQ